VTRSTPILLYILVAILVIDLIVLAVRLVTRPRRRRKARLRQAKQTEGAWDDTAAPADDEEPVLTG
jgi:hypothetical protein